MAGPEGGEKGGQRRRGLKWRKNLSTGADQGVGPAASCCAMGDFVRFMGKFLKRKNRHSVRFAKDFSHRIFLHRILFPIAFGKGSETSGPWMASRWGYPGRNAWDFRILWLAHGGASLPKADGKAAELKGNKLKR